MKVILLEDIKKLGKKNEIIEVSDGYANNCLLRKNLAMEATASNLNVVKTKQKAHDAKAAQELEQAKQTAAELETNVITLTLKCGDSGKLYGAITSLDVSGALKQAGYNVDKRNVLMTESIKALGRYEIELKLHTEVKVKIVLEVLRQS